MINLSFFIALLGFHFCLAPHLILYNTNMRLDIFNAYLKM